MYRSIFFRKKLLYSAIVSLVAAPVFAQDDGQIEEMQVFAQKIPYRGDVPLESLPQQVQVLSSQLLIETGKFEFQNAMDLAGGVARQNSFGGLWDSFAIRGFAGDENLPSAYLINGFSGGRGYSGNRDTSNIESIEVLKGPGSALYGRGEPGGTINIITKKPEFVKEGYIRATAGRFSDYRVEGDYTDALSENIAFRVNGSYRDSESFRDTVTSEKLVLTPSVLFRFTDSTSLNYELEYLSQEAPFDRGIVAIDYDPEVVDVSNFYGEPQDGPIEIEALGHQFLFQHDFSADWSLLAGLGYRNSTFDGRSSETELSGSRQILTRTVIQEANGVGANEFLNRQIRDRDYEADDLSGRVEITGTFDTGPFSHHLLVGVDAYDYELDTVQLRWRDAFNTSTYFVDVFNPVYGQPQTLLAGDPSVTDRLETQDNKGFYLQDQIDLSEQWQVLFGVRYDDFSQEVTNRSAETSSVSDESAFSPRAGLVFSPTDSLSFYASYGEGFRPNSGADINGDTFEPEESESYEVGAKFSSMSGDLTATVALFKMEKSNILTADPINAGFSAALGAAESEGIEIDVTGQITDTLSMMFNYAYVDAGTKTDLFNFDWGVTVPAGSPLINIPENSANLTLTQDLTLGGSPASIGATLSYVDDRLGETIDPDYVLPSYTLLSLFGSYELNEKVSFAMHLDNVTDEKYYVSSYHKWWTTPGTPFSWRLSADYRF